MNRYQIEGYEVVAFENDQEVRQLINKIDMIMIEAREYEPDGEYYIFELETGDTVLINDTDKSKLMLHRSVNGLIYKPVVNENADNDSLDIEYIGFQLIG